MDTSMPLSRGAEDGARARQPWYLSRFGIAVTLGALLGVANLVIWNFAEWRYLDFGFQLGLAS